MLDLNPISLVSTLLTPDLRLHTAFENPLTEVALFFHHASIPVFTNFNRLLQSDEPAIHVVHDSVNFKLFSSINIEELYDEFCDYKTLTDEEIGHHAWNEAKIIDGYVDGRELFHYRVDT